MTTRDDCLALDAGDPLADLRQLFALPDGVIYLDGNSLGARPRAAVERAAEVVAAEWGEGLIRSWNSADWRGLPERLGDKLAPLIGARAGEVVITDTTSINLFKVLSAALRIQEEDAPGRKVIVSESSNFPTDLYIAEGLTDMLQRGYRLRLVDDPEQLPAAIDADTAVVMLSHVNYKTGYLHDMREVTRLVHENGALAIWDLAHSAGALPLDLHAADADYAIGCTYKYLNGGPGSPAYVGRAAPARACLATAVRLVRSFPPVRHGAALPARRRHHPVPLRHPADHLAGPGRMRPGYLRPDRHAAPARQVAGPRRSVHRIGGKPLRTLRPDPGDPARACPARQPCQLRACPGLRHRPGPDRPGVIGDYREPGILRFGFTPLYTRFVEVWDAVQALLEILQSEAWKEPRYQVRHKVT